MTSGLSEKQLADLRVLGNFYFQKFKKLWEEIEERFATTTFFVSDKERFIQAQKEKLSSDTTENKKDDSSNFDVFQEVIAKHFFKQWPINDQDLKKDSVDQSTSDSEILSRCYGVKLWLIKIKNISSREDSYSICNNLLDRALESIQMKQDKQEILTEVEQNIVYFFNKLAKINESLNSLHKFIVSSKEDRADFLDARKYLIDIESEQQVTGELADSYLLYLKVRNKAILDKLEVGVINQDEADEELKLLKDLVTKEEHRKEEHKLLSSAHKETEKPSLFKRFMHVMTGNTQVVTPSSNSQSVNSIVDNSNKVPSLKIPVKRTDAHSDTDSDTDNSPRSVNSNETLYTHTPRSRSEYGSSASSSREPSPIRSDVNSLISSDDELGHFSDEVQSQPMNPSNKLLEMYSEIDNFEIMINTIIKSKKHEQLASVLESILKSIESFQKKLSANIQTQSKDYVNLVKKLEGLKVLAESIIMDPKTKAQESILTSYGKVYGKLNSSNDSNSVFNVFSSSKYKINQEFVNQFIANNPQIKKLSLPVLNKNMTADYMELIDNLNDKILSKPKSFWDFVKTAAKKAWAAGFGKMWGAIKETYNDWYNAKLALDLQTKLREESSIYAKEKFKENNKENCGAEADDVVENVKAKPENLHDTVVEVNGDDVVNTKKFTDAKLTEAATTFSLKPGR